MSYYSSCDDSLDPHFCRDCDDLTEKARIRRGGWLRKSARAAILVDPTDPLLWQAAIDAGDFIVLPELSGTFDGGAPKYGPGFGDQKEKYLGSDFVANIKDPMYKENWPHYKSLVGKSNWHFVYVTETQLHISGVAVTVAPKNPITENVDDDVIWEAEIKWFESFTPAPHDAPLEIFECNAAAVIEFRYGFSADVPIQGDIDVATSDSATTGSDLTVPDGGFGNTVDAIVFMAEPATEPEKTIWYNTSINNGAIGVGETFLVPVVIGDWRVYYTAEVTTFTGAVQFKIS
jgi:hypothetical protein